MFDIRRIAVETFIKRIEHHLELASTNDFAIEQLRAADAAELPLLVLAERQTRGRGRGDRSWWSADGALTFTVVLPLNALGLPPGRRPMLAMAAGLAVRDAIGDLIPGATLRLKWPNDVFLNDRKVCGILIESPARPMDVSVVGIGVNVNNAFAQAPPEIRRRAVSMIEVSGEANDLTEVLIRILRNLNDDTRTLIRQPEAIVARCRAVCLLTGSEIGIRTGPRTVYGRCEGIDEDGRLILQTARGTERFASGTIEDD